jgi:phosphate-selective porin OprO/OprP
MRLAWMLLPVLAAMTVAQEPAAPDARRASEEDRLARLEALLEAQDQRLNALRDQLAASSQADLNAARVDQLRQQIREILNEREFRESLMPSVVQAGYDSGFYIRSSDDKFRLNINGLFQFRWTYYATREQNHYLSPGLRRTDRSGFDLQRLRIRFSGNAYSPDLTYALELEQDAPDTYDTVLSEAWVNYRFADLFQFKAGYIRPATTRMQLVDNSAMQFVDRAMVDAVFGAGYATGVRLWGVGFHQRWEYYLDVLNAIANGENAALGATITTDENRQLDNNPAIAFRTVWHALGDNPGVDFAEDADLAYHTRPALDFGAHYLFNQDNGDLNTTTIPFPRARSYLPGGFGNTTSNGLQINQFGLDAAFKYRGFSLTGEYILRILDVTSAAHRPYTPLFLLTGDAATDAQHGAYVQAGYFLPIPGLEHKLEVVGRVGGISTLEGRQQGTWEYAGGLNYYIQGNKVKLQTDVTKVSEVPLPAPYSSLANVNDDALVFRAQLQVAF